MWRLPPVKDCLVPFYVLDHGGPPVGSWTLTLSPEASVRSMRETRLSLDQWGL